MSPVTSKTIWSPSSYNNPFCAWSAVQTAMYSYLVKTKGMLWWNKLIYGSNHKLKYGVMAIANLIPTGRASLCYSNVYPPTVYNRSVTTGKTLAHSTLLCVKETISTWSEARIWETCTENLSFISYMLQSMSVLLPKFRATITHSHNSFLPKRGWRGEAVAAPTV